MSIMCIYIYTHIHTYTITYISTQENRSEERFYTPPPPTTTSTQGVWCIEVFVSILAQLQSQKRFPGGGV